MMGRLPGAQDLAKRLDDAGDLRRMTFVSGPDQTSGT